MDVFTPRMDVFTPRMDVFVPPQDVPRDVPRDAPRDAGTDTPVTPVDDMEAIDLPSPAKPTVRQMAAPAHRMPPTTWAKRRTFKR